MGKLAALLEARNRHISKDLSLAHGTPLHIVRGEMQYLHASDGTQYLDLVNNVSHVGHCNPYVVEAGQRQRGVLLSTDGPLHNVIKIKPPMVLSEEDVDETLSKLGLCLSGN